MNAAPVLASLPRPIPDRIQRLPVDARGYPVPFFVQWLDVEGRPTRIGVGHPDFRISRATAIADCVSQSRCWICGDCLGSFKTFVIGPMCAVNRVTAEPPSHRDCADWAARACPFLVTPKRRRNEHDLPDKIVPPSGDMIRRNPGVALVWTTRKYNLFSDGRGGALFRVGDPTDVRWYAEGRTATRAECLESIETGTPILEKACEGEPLALLQLQEALVLAKSLLPAGPPP